nr:rhodanese-like domain-containing protein [uncultured Tolumonas sp.]
MLFRALLFIMAFVFNLEVTAKEWLIDVRTANEFNVEHVDGASNIEYQQIVLGAQQLGIQKQDTVLLYCRSGRRAEIARESLRTEGYQHVENLGSLQEAERLMQSSRIAVTGNR